MNDNYGQLRKDIHQVFYDFLVHEYKIFKDGEFDFEFMEYRTDDILHIIKNCGGDICEYETIFKNQREGDKLKCQNMKQLEKI